MTLASLLTQAGTLRRRSAVTPDAEGNPVASVVQVETVGRLDQQSTGDLADGDRRTTRLVLILGRDEMIDGSDQWSQDGRTYEVVGSPHLASSPRGPHHWEVELREVTP